MGGKSRRRTRWKTQVQSFSHPPSGTKVVQTRWAAVEIRERTYYGSGKNGDRLGVGRGTGSGERLCPRSVNWNMGR